MDDEQYLSTEQVSTKYGIPVATLRYWRHKGTGPKSAKLGGLVRYRASDVRAWADAQFAGAVGDELAAAE